MEKMETENHTANQEKKDNFFALGLSMGACKNEFTDVTILIGNQSFRSHRFLLASFSDYFYAMFGGNFVERHIKDDQPIVLHDVVDSEAFELILHFLYFGDVINITESNVYAVLTTVDFLKLKNPVYIETKCVELIRKNVEGSELIPNAVKIFKFSCVIKKEVLIDLLRKHICQHLCQLSTEDTFENICYEDLKELKRGYPFWMCNQDVVLNFLIGWVHHFRKERKHHFGKLVKFVDLKTVSSNCIFFLLSEYEKFIDWSEEAENKANDASFTLFTPSSVNDYAQSEVIFTFVKDNFSTLKEGEEFIPPSAFIVKNLPWRIKLRKTTTNYLGFFLQCDGTRSDEWTCSVKYKLRILSQKKGQRNFSRGGKNVTVFGTKSYSCGWNTFAKWDDMINPERGFIKDDTVIFQAEVTPV